jgi:hypothetical protein
VAALWRVDDEARLAAIEGEHGLTGAAVAARFHYKNRPGVQVIAARVLRLREPVLLPEARRYGGCVSWVELDEAVDAAGAVPVLAADAHAAKLARLHAALGPPTGDAGA